ncbi:hypothetical protein KKF84_19240 [Myxococcota bacterium]|nr:hypothetical protein [Myxococcota bacterium]
MELMRRGKEMVIRVEGRELMGTHVHGSEDALADIACDYLRDDAPELNISMLIGGLGIGFTLAAALRRVGPASRVVVAELMEAVGRWNRGPLGEAAGHPLEDERALLVIDDVANLIRQPVEPYDTILLDVDNGPHGITQESNNWLYSPMGLKASFDALRPGGVLGVWSAADDRNFSRRLERAGFLVKVHQVRARGAKGGPKHTIWMARR